MTPRRAVCPLPRTRHPDTVGAHPGLVIRTLLAPSAPAGQWTLPEGEGRRTAFSVGRYHGGAEDSLPVSFALQDFRAPSTGHGAHRCAVNRTSLPWERTSLQGMPPRGTPGRPGGDRSGT